MDRLYGALDALLKKQPFVLLGIDGRCGSGKTTLATALSRRYGARVFHMDDFYLPFDRRKEGWETTPGGNMDFERLRQEVILPAGRGEAVTCRPYRPRYDRWESPVLLPPTPLSILEGSYCRFPGVGELLDYRVFLTCHPEAQRRRLLAREGENFAAFSALWIPLEEGYFKKYRVAETSDLILEFCEKSGKWLHHREIMI